MIKIQFNIRTLIDKRDNRVIVRVRWNQKTNEVGFTTGMYAQEDKWDFLNQKAIKGTVHVIKSVVAHLMTLSLDAFEELRVFPDIVAHHEEGGLDVMLL